MTTRGFRRRILLPAATGGVFAPLFWIAVSGEAQEPPCPPPPKPSECPTELVTHPRPQFRPGTPTQCEDGEGVVHVQTPRTCWPEADPFSDPPGTNFLPTVYSNMIDGLGHEMPNTLPSTPAVAYNLHDGEPVVSKIDIRSPTDDLDGVFDRLLCILTQTGCESPGRDEGVKRLRPADELGDSTEEMRTLVGRGIDILEGNSVEGRAYSGFPVLHYNGPKKVGKVVAIKNDAGEVVGGNVDVHQVWYGGRIESDTALLDLSELTRETDGRREWLPVTWTVTYTIDVLNRGMDDFSPFVMYLDHPEAKPDAPEKAQRIFDLETFQGRGAAREAKGGPADEVERCGVGPYPVPPGKRLNHIAMDQTFFPMREGTRTVLKIKMTHPSYFNLIYTWGWRRHPPRVQVMENAGKTIERDGKKRTLPCFEVDAFGEDPTGSPEGREKAIGSIGDLAPAKRMWNELRRAKAALEATPPRHEEARDSVFNGRNAFWEWQDRTKLPSGVPVDPQTDLTLLYVNNTIYGQLRDGGWAEFLDWRTRGKTVKIALLNGDYFDHGYMNVDFGGSRGWENQFLSSHEEGNGCRFTFGRAHWSLNLEKMVLIPKAARPAAGSGSYEPVKKKVFITYNFEPSRRLRFYQFDPMHHDVAVYSLH